jgi:hypothetical protein
MPKSRLSFLKRLFILASRRGSKRKKAKHALPRVDGERMLARDSFFADTTQSSRTVATVHCEFRSS